MNAVLVDTSVWVDRFRRGNESLVDLLAVDMARSHPMVVAELACGTPPAPRARTLADVATLPLVRQSNLEEVRKLVEQEQLYDRGCGLVT